MESQKRPRSEDNDNDTSVSKKFPQIAIPIRSETKEAVKLSQFADDTTLICKDIESLKENIMIISKFAEISGLTLNKKKTKAIWIGLQRKNKTRPLAIDMTKSHNRTERDSPSQAFGIS